MNIVLYKDTFYNSMEMYNELSTQEYLDGIIVSLSMTKDGIILVYNFSIEGSTYVRSVQNQNFNELKENSFQTLNDFLNLYKNCQKNIIFNLVGTPNQMDKPNRNEQFVKNFKEIIKNYTQLNLYVSSAYDDIITYIIKYLDNVKKGMLVYEGNLNYYDVDFYIVSDEIFDTEVVAQQIKFEKEIMIKLNSCDSIKNILDEFKKNKDLFDSTKNIEKSISILTKCPYTLSKVLR